MGNKTIEEKTKLNWMEKRIVKKLIKKAKKRVLEIKHKAELTKKERDILEKELLSMTDILDIENDNGEELNETNIKKETNENLLETFEIALKEMEKLI